MTRRKNSEGLDLEKVKQRNTHIDDYNQLENTNSDSKTRRNIEPILIKSKEGNPFPFNGYFQISATCHLNSYCPNTQGVIF